MNILFLDDNGERTKLFLEFVPYAKTTETASGMIDLLKSQTDEIDMLFLDHDLGGEIFVDSNREDTGMEVVRWIDRERPSNIKNIIVHTHNDNAAEKMFITLEKAGYKVFYSPFKCTSFMSILSQIFFVAKFEEKESK